MPRPPLADLTVDGVSRRNALMNPYERFGPITSRSRTVRAGSPRRSTRSKPRASRSRTARWRHPARTLSANAGRHPAPRTIQQDPQPGRGTPADQPRRITACAAAPSSAESPTNTGSPQSGLTHQIPHGRHLIECSASRIRALQTSPARVAATAGQCRGERAVKQIAVLLDSVEDLLTPPSPTWVIFSVGCLVDRLAGGSRHRDFQGA
jgi:hypothetical protein